MLMLPQPQPLLIDRYWKNRNLDLLAHQSRLGSTIPLTADQACQQIIDDQENALLWPGSQDLVRAGRDLGML